MSITEKYHLYELAYDMIKEDDFELLHVNSRINEIWLNKTERKHVKIVRMIQRGFDWKNHLKRDIASVFQKTQSLRKINRWRKVEIINIYFAEFPPVDTWEQLKKPIQLNSKQNLLMNVYYIEDNNYQSECERLLEEMDSSINLDNQDAHNSEQVQAKGLYYKGKLFEILTLKKDRVRSITSFGTPRMIYLLLLINLIVYFIIELTGGSSNINHLINSGAKYNPAIIDGEWWRLISSMFIHVGMIHLILNMIALFYLGIIVEKTFGSIRFISIYFVSGIVGSLASFSFNVNVSAGSSGALFGVFGALLFFSIVYRHMFFKTMGLNVLLFILINFIIGLLIPQIDMSAHIVGFIIGFIFSAVLYVPQKQNRLIQFISLGLLIILLFSLVLYGYYANI